MWRRRFVVKNTILILLILALVLSLSACNTSEAEIQQAAPTAAGEAAPAVDATPTLISPQEALENNQASHAEAGDVEWDPATVVTISLNGNAIDAQGAGVTVDGGTATITTAGTYALSGSLSEGQVVVNVEDDGVVRLILNGVDIHNSGGPAILVEDAEKVVLIVADGTRSTLSDGSDYLKAAESDIPNAALYSKADLSIAGNGALVVQGNANDGIASSDGLVITGGEITVNAVDDGVRGKDYVVIENGTLNVTAGGDAIKADNEEKADRGYVTILQGALALTAGGDGIDAATDVLISDGQLALISGGGSANRAAEDSSARGIKASVNVTVEGGVLTIDSADDALHSNGSLVINGGTITLTAGDDGMHADAMLEINAGEVWINQSYEGIESAVITINGGNIHITASDDGVNVAGGVDGSGAMQGGPGRQPGGAGMPQDGPEMPQDGPGMPQGGPGMPQGRPGQDMFAASGNYFLYIHDGYLYVDAQGDGMDVNGAIEMTGGVVLVNGPTQQMNGALDYDAGFNISGGLLLAAGSAGMAMAPDVSSTQASVLVYFDQTQPGGMPVSIVGSDGQTVLSFIPTREYQSLVVSSPSLVDGSGYQVVTGGDLTGTATDGLMQAGAISGGNLFDSFIVNGAVTTLGSGGRMGPR